MRLVSLEITHLRNLTQVSISPAAGLNLVVGANASGKTSLLEAIHFLGLGRSFRTRSAREVIQWGGDALRVVGRIAQAAGGTTVVGVERDRGALRARVAGSPARNAAALAEYLPVQILTPESHKLIAEGPRFRRQFLDWGVFHVEQNFLSAWQDYHRALQQRNAALRRGEGERSLDQWERVLVTEGERLDGMRDRYLKILQPHVDVVSEQLLGVSPGLDYSPGWQRGEALEEVLRTQRMRDRERGHTGSGPHRADLKVTWHDMEARTVLSRGQLKLVVAALRLAQVALLREKTGQGVVWLVDDLAAELDATHRGRLMGLLAASGDQVFVSATERAQLETDGWESARVFHVEHGKVAEVIQ
ncbi:MAG: DNA replication/repair protein RecF [Pseudomonadota bacterium]|nr:MAG: DNA replication/repair protein RecF [Pseudomonadota bacterium]